MLSKCGFLRCVYNIDTLPVVYFVYPFTHDSTLFLETKTYDGWGLCNLHTVYGNKSNFIHVLMSVAVLPWGMTKLT
jgi:hypothetical protein